MTRLRRPQARATGTARRAQLPPTSPPPKSPASPGCAPGAAPAHAQTACPRTSCSTTANSPTSRGSIRPRCRRRALDLATNILGGAEGAPPTARGLPIGSLTSQWFANVALDRLDHFVCERLRVKAYLRYMDDMALFADDKATLRRAHVEVARFLRDELDLDLKARATRLAPAAEGLPFLGFLVFPRTVRVRPESLRRFAWRLRFLRWALAQGRIDDERYRRGVASVVAHMSHADTLALRRVMFAEDSNR